MDWISAVPAMFAAYVVIFMPGLLAGLILRARGLFLFVVGPMISLSLLGVLSFILPIFGLYWRPLLVITLTMVLSVGIAWLFRIFGFSFTISRTYFSARRHAKFSVAGAVCLSGLILAGFFVVNVPNPESFAAFYDNTFHLNATRYVTETLNYSATKITRLVSYKDGGVYPDLWHLIASLITQMTGASVPMSFYSLIVISLGVLWPINVVFLIRFVSGESRLVLLVGAVISAMIPSFPFGMIIEGPQYPNLLSFLFLPSCLILVALCWRTLGKNDLFANRKSLYLVTAVALGGSSLAHPGIMPVIFYFIFALSLAKLILLWKHRGKADRMMLILGAEIGFVLVAFAYLFLNPGDHWLATTTVVEALNEVLQLSWFSSGNELAIAICGLVATIYGFRKRQQFLSGLGIFAVFFAIIFIMCKSSDWDAFRYLGSIWYGDAQRISGIIEFAIIPLASLGFKLCIDYLNSKRKRIFVFVGISLMCLSMFNGFSTATTHLLLERYHPPSFKSDLLSNDEMRVLSTLSEHIPKGERILGDPGTGASLSYLFYGYQSFKPHLLGDLTDDEKYLWDNFHNASDDPHVCELVRKLNVHYALYFPGPRTDPEQYKQTGVIGLPWVAGVKEIERSGDARLYRVTACGD